MNDAVKKGQKRKRMTARQRGYFPRSEAAASLRGLANRLDQEDGEGNTSLIKMTLNMWFTPDDELEPKISTANEPPNVPERDAETTTKR